jgi:tRNA(fMet)-specific endonuclease VapC
VTPSRALLDTDVLSAVLRRDATALSHARTYLAVHLHFTLSIITRYEILRGLEAKRATTQMQAFDRFCAANQILPLTDAIIVRAAAIYGDLHRRGALIGDADILIAASALEHGLDVVTNNESHFSRIPSVNIQNWLC